jgi:phage baseplate assembly protein W
MAGYSARLPISTDPNDGFTLLQTLKDVAIQNVKMVLYTQPGERIWDMDFGVGVKRYLFEQNTTFTHEQLRIRIANQINKYLPYINIINLQVYAINNNDQVVGDGSSNFIKINLLFNISGLGEIILEEIVG